MTQLSQLMSTITSKKVWIFLIKIQLTKSDPKKDNEIKVSPLMPIKVNIIINF